MLIETPQDMQNFGALLGKYVQPGDLIMLNGPIGAGKTTLVRGMAAQMGVAGRVQSPTFVIAVVHKGQVNEQGQKNPDLVHVDAYRIENMDDLDALDIDASLADSVTVVEWGAGKIEALTAQRLVVNIIRPQGASAEQEISDLAEQAVREVTLEGIGQRGIEIQQLLEAEAKQNA